MTILHVKHRSEYCYAAPVILGPHRPMSRPRDSLVGGGATHAWIQVDLPGVGWVEFDPTNALVGGRNLIRVAVAREASQAAPLAGSFTGMTSDFMSLFVNVEVIAQKRA